MSDEQAGYRGSLLFKYHPDPLGTGSIVPTDEVCEVCGRQRGYKYCCPIYGENDLEVVCPWCIADGSAHDRFDAEFTDPGGIGRGHAEQWDPVSPEVI